MQRRTHATRALCSLLGSMLPLAGAVGQTYSLIDFATLGPAPISVAAINARGVSAGTVSVSRNNAFFSDGVTIFFIPVAKWSDGTPDSGASADQMHMQ